ncbi:nucleoside-diphosphate sugar epimerase/dehydratase [Frigoribacterium sp. VKM Ac-2530]|uniref:polysaccharide biosynthesis protein n=1 Tax=Frigoribacterium sp. VKM Ac-2530 TaxID=2783822 RepID=UPI00188DB37D|nr:nucleoside-diphosphate sugar epimerase/dehydratase [Frigoribacterium sp. VKM Ac-2530]MBF4578664.1 polysaccharide biosynthesis protein [Frigoribacterium sp. VKM Ac-2530]
MTSPARRTALQVVLDGLAWVVAVLFAVSLRYDFAYDTVTWNSAFVVTAVAVLVGVALGFATGLYRRRFVPGSFAEVRAVARVVFVTGLLVGLPVLVLGTEITLARSTVIIAVPVAFALMGGLRYIARLYVEGKSRPGESAQPTLIFGAGRLANHLVRRMLTDPASPYLPVGLIDDDPTRSGLRIEGVPVLGTRRDLVTAAHHSGAEAIIVGVARADAPLLQELSDLAREADLRLMVLPLLDEILEGKSRLGDVRDIAIEDIIGRHPVDTQVESIAGYLAGKRVLVTGAGGSIGSELCRQIAKFGPAELIMLDRDETGLQQSQLSISGNGLLDTKEVVLADIRDPEALRAIFADRRPEVVFHAAALKHLPMLEQYPDEAWKTNVLGTQNVLDAAKAVGVATFVNISTDKAANPTSVLGHSKRLAERLTAWAADETGARYLSVRFGNVLGSRGSMLPVFTSLIEAGGPVTITHPDVTRFFMTIPEACHLVVQAGGIGAPSEVLILDMGEPVKILDIAERMIAMSGRDIGIVYTGLREGEKMHEELVGLGESDNRPVHPKISHTTVPPLHPSELIAVRSASSSWHVHDPELPDLEEA